MWKNKVFRRNMYAITCFLFALGGRTVVIADGEEIPTEVIPTDPVITETDPNAQPVEEVIDQSGLTPEGNATVQDDITSTSTGNIEFMTVTTKDNNTFYIVIEHDKGTNNVHFLNQVDERDLMALLSEEEKEEIDSEIEEKTEPITTPEPTVQVEKNNETDTFQIDIDDPWITTGIFVTIGAVIIGIYYVKKKRSKNDGSTLDEDLAFYDDEEYEEEDEDASK